MIKNAGRSHKDLHTSYFMLHLLERKYFTSAMKCSDKQIPIPEKTKSSTLQWIIQAHLQPSSISITKSVFLTCDEPTKLEPKYSCENTCDQSLLKNNFFFKIILNSTLYSSMDEPVPLHPCYTQPGQPNAVCIKTPGVSEQLWCPPFGHQNTRVAAEWLFLPGNSGPMIAFSDAAFSSTWPHYISPEDGCQTFPHLISVSP